MEDKVLFMDRLSAQLVHWEHELDELKICVDEMARGSKTDLLERVAELRAMKDETKVKLAQLMEGGDEAWNEARTGIEKSWVEMKTAFTSAWAKLWEEELPDAAA